MSRTWESWADVPYIFIDVPVCWCGGTEFIVSRTETYADGGWMQKAVCKKCSKRSKIVPKNLPAVGKAPVDSPYD